MIPVYNFDAKYAADTDGFTFNLSAWLGDFDTLAATPTITITPSGATIVAVIVSGPLITVWISGGTAGQTYVIDLRAVTTGARNCHIRATFAVEA